MNTDYVRLAPSEGLRPGRVLVRHTLRNALIPLTTSAALDTAFRTSTRLCRDGRGRCRLRST